MLRPASGTLQMMVAGVYALAFLLVAALPLALFGVSLSSVLLGLLAFALYRGARMILGLSIASAIAYAALSVVLLVALPLSLYMLISPGPGGPI